MTTGWATVRAWEKTLSEALYEYEAERLASLIAQAIAEEREACAKLAEGYDACQDCSTHEAIAAMIRARGQQ